MANDFDAEAAKKIIDEDNINVTETNPIKELMKVVLQLALVLVIVYFFIYISLSFVLYILPADKQMMIENFISPSNKFEELLISKTEKEKLYKIKNNILKVDLSFPNTSNAQIKIIKYDKLNAFCYPNGNIYITSGLYKKLKTDEELTFIMAHEMAHYKNKDHLLMLRRNISSMAVLLFLAAANPNDDRISSIVSDGLDITDLKYSRAEEEKADKYAIEVMNKLYGNSKAGVEVMELLKEENDFNMEFLSTHPNLDRRIKYIKKLSY